jgi:PTH1 family peptidyl-tRNA hydrolase
MITYDVECEKFLPHNLKMEGSTTMIKVVAPQPFKEAITPEVKALLEEMIAATRKEDGCISYELCKTIDGEEYAFIEQWETQEALDAHMNSEHFKRLIPQIGAFQNPGKKVNVYTVYL